MILNGFIFFLIIGDNSKCDIIFSLFLKFMITTTVGIIIDFTSGIQHFTYAIMVMEFA